MPVAAPLSPLPLHAGVASCVRRRPLQKKHLADLPLAHQQRPLLVPGGLLVFEALGGAEQLVR